MSRKHKDRDDMTLGFKLWFAFCAVLGLAWLGVCIWAVIALVNWVTSHE